LDANVKSVTSGDTLVLSHPTKPSEKTITLAGINAPRMAQRGTTSEEPLAFDAREFLRKQLIGKKVKFSVEYTNPKTGRDYGTVWFNGKNMGEELLRAGFATLKERKSEEESYKSLEAAQNEAREGKVGVHQENFANLPKRNIVWADKDSFDAEARLKSFKGKPVNVIVEHVINGASMRVLLPQTNEMVVLQLTGITAPSLKSQNPNKPSGKKEQNNKPSTSTSSQEGGNTSTVVNIDVAHPFAHEARHFTEIHLLNREVTVLFDSVDKFKNLYGSILLSGEEKKDEPLIFQERLLQEGLVKLSEWSAINSKYSARLREAENKAKKSKLRVWKSYVEPTSSLSSADTKEFTARVVDVQSGDTLRLKKEDGTEERVSLSSIRAPRPGFGRPPATPATGKEAEKTPSNYRKAEDWHHEARESIKRQIAGKKVTVRVDYRRKIGKRDDVTGEAPADSEDRRFVTILVNGKNIAIEPLQQGYLNVTRHSPQDADRSMYYDQLVVAETSAQKQNRGIHNKNKKPPKYQINDISNEKEDVVNKYFNIMKDKQLKGQIEKVLSGTRYKVLLPTQDMMITFSLSGVSSPAMRPKESPATPKPFAKEALHFAVDNLLFREVDITIEGIDKSGAILGDLFVGKNENFSIKLLENGLAQVQKMGKSKKKNIVELKEAEAKAKGAYEKPAEGEEEPNVYPNGINVWSVDQSVYRNPNAVKREKREKPQTDRFTVYGTKQDVYASRVTSVLDVEKFFIQRASSEADLTHLEELMSSLNLDSQSAPQEPLSEGTLIFAKYAVDDTWYRARVTSVSGNKLQVTYIDFGNSESVDVKNVRALNKDSETGKMGAIAIECRLAFVNAHEENFRSEATLALKDLTEDRDLTAQYEYTENGITYVTLEDGENGSANNKSVNEELILEGLVFVDHSLKGFRGGALDRKLEKLSKLEDKAKRERLNLWENGDVYGDDDEL